MEDETNETESTWNFTVNVSDQGRLYIPAPVRRAMGINHEEAVVQLEAHDVETRRSEGDT